MAEQLNILVFKYDSIVNEIASCLERTIIDPKSIQRFVEQLHDIAVAHEHVQGTLKDDRLERINTLLNQCFSHLLNAKIDHLTEKAQELFHSGTCKKELARQVRKKILTLVKENALSLENRSMILFARKLLQGVDPNGKRLASPKNDEWGMQAYEIAHYLYEDELKEALVLIHQLPVHEKQAIEEWVDHAGSNMESLESLPDLRTFAQTKIGVIRGLIGYATGELPTVKEMHRLFAELKAVIESA